MGDGFSTLLTNSWDDVQSFFGINGHTTASLGPNMTPAQVKSATGAATMQNAGMLMTVMGGINSAVGGYFQAKSQQYQDKSQALNLGYQADMAAINSRSAEYSAESTLEAGKSQVANMTMAAGQQTASTTATMAAHGVRLGVGSTADITASQNIVKDINAYTINANATRAAAQDRTQATNFSNASLMDRTSAANATASANSVSPFSALSTSLMTSASSVAQQWNNSRQTRMMYAYYGG
jgi:adenine-specific DNA methylase